MPLFIPAASLSQLPPPYFPTSTFLSLATLNLLGKICSGKLAAMFNHGERQGKCSGFSLGVSDFVQPFF